MLRLYYAPMTRALRPRWLLEELEEPYELVRLDLSRGEHKSPEYLAIHPHGVVPALVDGDVKLMESAAICMYLADKFPEKGLAPAVGTPARAPYYQWFIYAMATVEPPLLQYNRHTRRLPEDQRSPERIADSKAKVDEVGRVVGAALFGRRFLSGERFTAADVVLGSMLLWATTLGLYFDGHPGIRAYLERLTSRPAYIRASAD